jgi:acetylornithine/succinyldiaminopimelate/putrescine aminotransferase
MRSNLDLVEQEIIWIPNYDVVPDVVVMGKGMGGGMPVGALHSSEMMDLLSDNPKLGHITTLADTLSLRQHVSLHCKKLLKPISWRKH